VLHGGHGRMIAASALQTTIKKAARGGLIAYEGDYCGVNPAGFTKTPLTSAICLIDPAK